MNVEIEKLIGWMIIILVCSTVVHHLMKYFIGGLALLIGGYVLMKYLK